MSRIAIIVTTLIFASGLARAEGAGGSFRVDGVKSHTGFSAGGGIGFTAGPDSFLMLFQAPYDFGNGFSLGPQLQLGLKSNFTLVGAAADGRYAFDLSSLQNEIASRFEPFASVGFGLTYMKVETNVPFFGKVSADETDFMMNFGFGTSYPLNDRIVLESAMQFNIVPGAVLGDKFYYTWQMLGVRYRF